MRDGVHFRGTPGRRTIYYDEILVPLPVEFHERVGLSIFLNILDKTNLDSKLALLAFDRTTEVDWASMTDSDPWLPYEWESGSVFRHLKPCLEALDDVLRMGLILKLLAKWVLSTLFRGRL